MGVGPIHQAAVKKILVDNRAKAFLFRKTLCAAVKKEHDSWLKAKGFGEGWDESHQEWLDGCKPSLNVLPDAYRIFIKNKPPLLKIWEVEKESKLDIQKYHGVHTFLDVFEWDIEIHVLHLSSGAENVIDANVYFNPLGF